MRNTISAEDLLLSRILEASNPGRERCYHQPQEKPESTKTKEEVRGLSSTLEYLFFLFWRGGSINTVGIKVA